MAQPYWDCRKQLLTRRGLMALGLGVALGCRKRETPQHLGQLADFQLVDQHQHRVGTQELRGQVWVAAFFFTRCPTVCPRITRRMVELQKRAAQGKLPLRLVSFSVDPEHDTPSALLAYAQRFEADLTTWSFLTGDAQQIQRTVVDGFKIALEGRADANAEHYGILHGSHLVLVDRALNLRGYYRTSEDEELTRLLTDAAQLI